MKKMINVIVIFIFTAILFINTDVEDANAKQSYQNEDQIQYRDGYPVNSNGETYGADIRNSDVGPDLILTTFGGYIKQKDIDSNVETLEDALSYSENQENGRIIPLYEANGETIIGEYYLGGM